jgi:hypothetical protein
MPYHGNEADYRWTGDFSSISGRIEEAPSSPTYLRLLNGQIYEIALKNVTISSSGGTLGEFYGRGNPPSG